VQFVASVSGSVNNILCDMLAEKNKQQTYKEGKWIGSWQGVTTLTATQNARNCATAEPVVKV